MAEEPTTIAMTDQSACPSIPSAERIELFVRLIGQHQYQIHRYLLSLVPNSHDADDLFQQTNLFLWREFHRFEEGTSFVSWACAVAYHEVLAWRKSKLRERLVFSPEFLQAVSLQWDLAAERIEQRSQALVHCVSKLPQHHKELIQRRYGEHHRIETIAESLQRTPDAIYRMLSRIRHALHACVEQTLELQAK
jgi:RNA polymerase sigma-70 factor (ECF subfamily)